MPLLEIQEFTTRMAATRFADRVQKSQSQGLPIVFHPDDPARPKAATKGMFTVIVVPSL